MTDETNTSEKIRTIEHIVGQVVRRDISPLVASARGGLYRAAKSLADHPRPSVGVVTGFFIPTSTPPAAETDGLGGSVHLAAGLMHAGIPAMLITDEPCAGALRAAAAGVDENIPVKSVDLSDEAVVSLQAELTTLDPPISHLVSIERVGPSIDGHQYNMHRSEMSDYTAPLHLLFEKTATGTPWSTIGIGDGGNEIGMGKLPGKLIEEHIPGGRDIACAVSCDHLIVCGVSNWGGMALLVAYALLRPDLSENLTHHLNAETDKRILESAVYNGPAIDGDTNGRPGQQQMTVDDIPWRRHADMLEELATFLAT